jgi:hypothetical protein
VNWRDHYRALINDCHVTILHDTEDLGCTRPVNEPWCGSDFPHVTIHHFKQEFNLKEIDFARIRVESEPSFEAYAVKLTTVNERPLVVHSMKLGAEFRRLTPLGEVDYEAYVVLRMREAAERVAKAFRRAADVCGAKASAF